MPQGAVFFNMDVDMDNVVCTYYQYLITYLLDALIPCHRNQSNESQIDVNGAKPNVLESRTM